MEKAELIERLKGYEWNDVEFKRALRGVPDSAYETVSAFSNTGGGWLVFGIRDGAGGYEFVGVLEVDKVQNDFLSVLRSGQKLNRVIAVDERLIEDDGKALLVFHIPEARRQDKPIYLGGDIRRSFIRRGAGDERCTQTEIERLLRDAADERHDGEVVDLDPERCFDDGSVRWYRKLFDDRNPTQDTTKRCRTWSSFIIGALWSKPVAGCRRPVRRFSSSAHRLRYTKCCRAPWWTGSGAAATGRRSWPTNVGPTVW